MCTNFVTFNLTKFIDELQPFSLGFSVYSITSAANNDSFVSSFSNLDSVCFSSLTAIARTSKTMLNRSGKSGHACLVPDLRGNDFTFSLLSIMLAVGLSYMTFEVCTQIMLRYVLSMSTC